MTQRISRRWSFVVSLLLIGLLGWPTASGAPSVTVLVSANANIVRFSAQAQDVQALGVAVFNLNGRKIFDSGFHNLKALAWSLINSQGQKIANGVYLYVTSVQTAQGLQRQVGKIVVLHGRPIVSTPTVASPPLGKPSGTPTSFSGQATVVRATVLGLTTTLCDTGPQPSTGDALECSLLTGSVPGVLTVQVLHGATIGQGDRSRSEASVANLNLIVGGNTIGADFLMARAMAVCTSGSPSVSGSSEIAALVINGQSIVVTGQPNQTIALPNGQVVINEQTSTVHGKTGTITVNALHVVVNGIADVVISSAHADITCGTVNCASAKDFVTGGGWITGTPSGAKGNFGVAGGIKQNSALWGHLTYIDHGTNGPSVKGTGVTAYVIVNATTRHIEGTAEINGQGGFTYTVDVADNGEPGRNDTFVLTLSNGYSASGSLAGGNIQLHKPCQ